MQSRRIRRPTVALVGRTNVGKSTLFNKMLEEHRAIVSAVPGTTRDRNYGVARWRGFEIQFVDTGGLDADKSDEIERNVARQAELAMAEADLILFVVDLDTGPLPQDKTLAAALSKSKKPVILVGNKADNPRLRANAFDSFWPKLRFGAVFPTSGKNGTGVGDLLDEILNRLGQKPAVLPEAETIIAVIGRPNVGKSSLVNSLCREDRLIVSPVPGTTREPQDTLIEVNGRRYLLVDTVGLRRRKLATPKLESQGVERTERAIERAEVLFLVLDATSPVTSQDRTLAGLAAASGKAVVLVVNKWDALPGKNAQTMFEKERDFKGDLAFFDYAPFRLVSAKTGDHVDKLLDEAEKVKANWKKEIPEKQLDGFFRRVVAKSKNKGPGRPYILRMAQTGAEPPTFALTVRGKEPVPTAFLRYVENRLREKFDFLGTPLRIRGKNVSIKP